MRRGPWALVLLLVAACSLPLPAGVHTTSAVPSQQQAVGLEVLPQGPTPGQTQTGVVSGFLAAQASPAGDYAIARQFLMGDAARSWSPSAGIRVYQPQNEVVEAVPIQLQPNSVRVQLDVVGDVDASGHFVAAPERVNDSYGLTKTAQGWRVSRVPEHVGLQLSLPDLQRTFPVHDVYYLAPQAPGTTSRHLAPDRVFLPKAAGATGLDTLVRRAFAPPSPALADAVEPVLSGITPQAVTVTRDGTITVTLSEDANGLGADDLRNLSARLLWTLRSSYPNFNGLRLRTARAVLRPPGSADVQPPDAWRSFDPQALADDPAYYFVVRDRVRSSGPEQPATSAKAESVVVSPRGDRLATLRTTKGQVTVTFGSLRSTVTEPGGPSGRYSSPSWGSGEAGLWLVSGAEQVVRLRPGTAVPDGVPTPHRPAGAITSLAVSRDGTRAALVIADHVYVAQVVWHQQVPSLESFQLLRLPGSSTPTRVLWSTPTELVLLQPDQGARAVLRMAVDGSASSVVLTGRLVPTGIAAAGSALVLASGGALYSVSQGITKVQPAGSAPAFPG